MREGTEGKGLHGVHVFMYVHTRVCVSVADGVVDWNWCPLVRQILK